MDLRPSAGIAAPIFKATTVDGYEIQLDWVIVRKFARMGEQAAI